MKRPEYISSQDAMQALHTETASYSTDFKSIVLFSFNVNPEELDAAHLLLDKQCYRRAMRVTYNHQHNFIVKYMPGGAHETAHRFLIQLLRNAAIRATGQILPSYGYECRGSQTFRLVQDGRKEPDSCIVPDGALSPSVAIEVGCLETITQLQGDAKRWLESTLLDVKLVILISIDSPAPTAPQNPRITIEHWKSAPPPNQHDLRTPPARPRVVSRVWTADWTFAPSTYSIPLADIFGAFPIPLMFGANTHLDFTNIEVAAWRQSILNAY